MTPEMVAKVVRSTGGKRPISLSITKTHTKESKVLQCSWFGKEFLGVSNFIHDNYYTLLELLSYSTSGIPASSSFSRVGQFRRKGFGKNLAKKLR